MNFTSVEELMVASNQSLPQPVPFDELLTASNRTITSIPLLHPVNVIQTGHLFKDVHQFDYSYKDQPFLFDMAEDEKIKWIHAIKFRMTNPIAQHGVDLILANINQNANYDVTNQKRAEDLLAAISKHIDTDQNLLPLIEEQLQDMVQLGQCAQGRTTRLWQIYTLLPKEQNQLDKEQ
jgi:hypothetical protein